MKKIDWKRLFRKAAEDGIKKAVELLILLIVLGASSNLIFVGIPVAFVASLTSKTTQLMLFD